MIPPSASSTAEEDASKRQMQGGVGAKREAHHTQKKEYWQSELASLGIDLRGLNDLNDKMELEELAEVIKQTYYLEYKTAYGVSSNRW
jgi:hypothetical protein